jgi:histone deacetylase 1/2
MSVLPVCSHCPTFSTYLISSATEHARYVYNIQESDTPSEDSEEDSWDSDDSASSHRRTTRRSAKASVSRKHMSLLTGHYFDVPTHENGYGHYECGAVPGKAAKRRFFQSGARWDETMERVLLGKHGISPIARSMNLGELMERGGRIEDELEDDWEDMAVET